MTHFLGWSTHNITSEQWQLMSDCLRQGDLYYEQEEKIPTSIFDLVDIQIFREHHLSYGTFFEWSYCLPNTSSATVQI